MKSTLPLRPPRPLRRGVTLIELMIALVLLALVSTSLTQIIRSQVRFADAQGTANQARYISRASLNLLLSDVRMVDADSGIVVATPDSFTVTAPYAEGIVCGTSTSGPSATVIALLPYDSVGYAEGGYSGYAYIDTTTTGTAFRQVYQYKFSGVSPVTLDSGSVASSAPCNTSKDAVRIFRAGAVAVQPIAPAQAQYQAAMLVRRITYAFRASTSVPGARGLFRTVVNGTHGSEEVAAPFDTSARFMYYLNTGTKSASASGVTLNTVRGIELQLNAKSDHIVAGASRPESAPMTTAIFFKNRPVK
jgi:prepilin-type N-terminal cleavage/methylation domain-containing protein